MNGENRSLVTNEQVSLENNRFKLKALGELAIALKKCVECSRY